MYPQPEFLGLKVKENVERVLNAGNHQSFFFSLLSVWLSRDHPSVRLSVLGAPDGGLQEASLDIHPLSVRKLRILFLRTLSR